MPWETSIRSRHRPRRSSRGQLVEPVSAAKPLQLGAGVIARSSPASNETLHGAAALFPIAQIAPPDRLPDQFGDGGLLRAGTSVERAPELIVEIELRPPHDVYYAAPTDRRLVISSPRFTKPSPGREIASHRSHLINDHSIFNGHLNGNFVPLIRHTLLRRRHAGAPSWQSPRRKPSG